MKGSSLEAINITKLCCFFQMKSSTRETVCQTSKRTDTTFPPIHTKAAEKRQKPRSSQCTLRTILKNGSSNGMFSQDNFILNIPPPSFMWCENIFMVCVSCVIDSSKCWIPYIIQGITTTRLITVSVSFGIGATLLQQFNGARPLSLRYSGYSGWIRGFEVAVKIKVDDGKTAKWMR